MKRRDAKRVTAEECEYGVFKAIKYEVEDVRGMKEAVYSYDKAAPHIAAASFFGWQEGSDKCAPMCAKSPDMHRVPEHSIRQAKRTFFKAAIKKGTQTMTAREAQKLLIEVCKKEITAEMVAKDAEKLVTTMRVIAASAGATVRGQGGKAYRGTGGDWAPKELR